MLAGITLVSCQNDDTDFSDIIAQYQVEPTSIELDFSALDEAPDVPVTDEDDPAYNDYVENTQWDKVININFGGETPVVTGTVPGVTVHADGDHITVVNMSGPVKFVVSGQTANGSLKFYGDNRFQILLNGANITNPHGAAINNQGSKTLYMVMADGTKNQLKDGADYDMVDEEDQKAALFSEGQIVFSGKGRLDVFAEGRGAIRSDDYIRIRPGVNLYIESHALDGLRANDGITLDGGVINVLTDGEGAKGVRDTLVTVNAGTLKFKATGDGGKGLNAKHNVVMTGGSFQAVATGTSKLKKAKGVKIDGDFSISGGYFYTYSRLSDPLEVSGTLQVASGYKTYDKGIRVITISY